MKKITKNKAVARKGRPRREGPPKIGLSLSIEPGQKAHWAEYAKKKGIPLATLIQLTMNELTGWGDKSTKPKRNRANREGK